MKTINRIWLGMAMAVTAVGATPAGAEADALFQIHHTLRGANSAGGPGHVQIEIRNLGSEAVDEVAGQVQGPAAAWMAPIPFEMGRLEPGQARMLSLPLPRAEAMLPPGPTMWRIDYLDADGNPRQVIVLGIGSGLEE